MPSQIFVGQALKITGYVRDENNESVDLRGSTVLNFLLKAPSGGVKECQASFLTDGRDGAIQYTTIPSDLSVPGDWHIQGYVVTPEGPFPTDIHLLMVYPTLE